MGLTSEERASLERLREPGHGYEKSQDTVIQRFLDEQTAIDLALADYPAGDTCEMSRQELIAEVERLKRRYHQLDVLTQPEAHPLWEP